MKAAFKKVNAKHIKKVNEEIGKINSRFKKLNDAWDKMIDTSETLKETVIKKKKGKKKIKVSEIE